MVVIGQVKGEALPLHAMKAYREKWVSTPLILNLHSVIWGKQSASCLGYFSLRKRIPRNYWLEGSVYPRASLDVLERKHLDPAGIQTLGSPVHTLVTTLTTLSHDQYDMNFHLCDKKFNFSGYEQTLNQQRFRFWVVILVTNLRISGPVNLTTGHDAVFPEIGSHAINVDYHEWYGWPQLYYITTTIQGTNLARTLTHSAL